MNCVLKDEKDFNKDLRIEGPVGAKISRHTSEGCILKLIRTSIDHMALWREEQG